MHELAAIDLAAGHFQRLGAGWGAGLGTVGATSFLGIHFFSGTCWVKHNLSPIVWADPAVMHNFSGATFLHDASLLFTMGRRDLHNSALREHFQRSEECNGSEQRRCTRALTTTPHSCGPVQYDTDVFYFGW